MSSRAEIENFDYRSWVVRWSERPEREWVEMFEDQELNTLIPESEMDKPVMWQLLYTAAKEVNPPLYIWLRKNMPPEVNRLIPED